jgi:hypothetical protein
LRRGLLRNSLRVVGEAEERTDAGSSTSNSMNLLRRLGASRSPEPSGQSSGSEPSQAGPREGRKRKVRRPILEGRPTVFFVVGHGKSGTTWVARLLGSHPDVLCLWEGRFFGREWHREDLGEVEARVPPRTLSGAIANSADLKLWAERSVWARRGDADEHLRNLTRLALDYFLDQRLAGTDKKIVGDKTPFLPGTHTVREIHDVYPEAKVIHVIRDGRDAEVSWMHHRWNRSTERGGIQVLSPEEAKRREAYLGNPKGDASPGLFDEAELRARAAQWSETVGEARREGPELLGDNYTEVRYEVLISDAPAETARLLRFLGAGAGDEAVRRCVEAASFEKLSGGRRPGEEDPASPVRKGVTGDWRGAFTEGDRRVYKEEAGDLLVELGYEENHNW